MLYENGVDVVMHDLINLKSALTGQERVSRDAVPDICDRMNLLQVWHNGPKYL